MPLIKNNVCSQRAFIVHSINAFPIEISNQVIVGHVFQAVLNLVFQLLWMTAYSLKTASKGCSTAVTLTITMAGDIHDNRAYIVYLSISVYTGARM